MQQLDVVLKDRTLAEIFEEGLHLPEFLTARLPFPSLWRVFPEMLLGFISVNHLPIPLDPIPLKRRMPGDFVAPGPRKTGFVPYQETKAALFFAHPEVLKNYLLKRKNACYELKD